MNTISLLARKYFSIAEADAQDRERQNVRFKGILTDIQNLADVFLNDSSGHDFAFVVQELVPYKNAAMVKSLLNKRRQLCREFSELYNKELQTILLIQNNGKDDSLDSFMKIPVFLEGIGWIDEDVRAGHSEKTAKGLGIIYGAMSTGVAGYRTLVRDKLRKLIKILKVFPKHFAKFLVMDCIVFDVVLTMVLLAILGPVLAHEKDLAERVEKANKLSDIQKAYLYNLQALSQKLGEIDSVERQILQLVFPGSDKNARSLRKSLRTIERLAAALNENSMFVDPSFLKNRIERMLKRYEESGTYIRPDPEIHKKIDEQTNKHEHLHEFWSKQVSPYEVPYGIF